MAQKKKADLAYMSREEIEQEKKNRRKGLIGASIIYGIILAILIYYQIPKPNPPLQDIGSPTIILGTDAIGMNNTHEQVARASSAPQPVESQPAPEPEAAPETPVVTDPNSVAIEEKKEPKEEKTKPTAETKPQQETPKQEPVQKPKEQAKPQRTIDEDLLLGKSDGTGESESGTASSKGTGNTPGNQGDRNGSADGDFLGRNGGGNGPGNALLAGRKAVKEPSRIPDPGKRATLVLEIIVDADGNIMEVNGPARGTVNISDVTFINQMKEVTKQNYKFTASPTGQVRQKGSVTYEFYPKN